MRARAPRKDTREMLALASNAGFVLDRYTGTGHYKLHHPNGGTLIIPSTPSGSHWKQNILADIRRRAKRREERGA